MSETNAAYYGHCPKCGQPSTSGGFLCGCKQGNQYDIHRECNRVIPVLTQRVTEQREHIAALEAKLAACQWVPITRKGPFPDNEQLVLAQTTEPLYRVMRFSSHLRKLYSDEGIEVTVRDISAWMPINPPQQGAK